MARLAALRHRDFRLFLLGQGVSLVGTWMQRVAFAWLAYRLTGSALLLGLVVFLSQLPTLILAPFAGVLLDRRDRRRVLLLTQSLAMAQALLLAGLAHGGALGSGGLLLLAVLLGLVEAVDAPARQALLPALLPVESLGSAITLLALLVNGARLLGPLLGGAVVVAFGEATCFLLNGLSFAAMLGTLLLLRPARQPAAAPRRARPTAELREGLRYAFTIRPLGALLLLLAAVSLLGGSYVVLLPALAREVLGGDARTLGLLGGATAVGAVLGALYLGGRRGPACLLRSAGAGAVLLGAGLTLLALARALPAALLALTAVGLGVLVCSAAVSTLLQTLVAEEKRGRVMGLYSAAFVGMLPPGALLAGELATRLGLSATLLLSGLGCLAAGLAFLAAHAGGRFLVPLERLAAASPRWLLLLLLLPLGCRPASPPPARPERVWFEAQRAVYGGTPARLKLWLPAAQRTEGEELAQACWAELDRLGTIFNSFSATSEVGRLNAKVREASSGSTSGQVSRDLAAALEVSRRVHTASGGAFDPTVWPLKRLWREAVRVQRAPSDEELASAAAALGLSRVVLQRGDPPQVTLRGVELDLGGVAKGYAVDRLGAILRARGVTTALVQLGGEILAYGESDLGPWRLGVQHPTRRGELYGVIEQRGAVRLSTSGNYQQPLRIGGREYYHIFVPATGRPAETRVRGVTLASFGAGPDSATLDAAATAAVVLGGERGVALARALGAEALLIEGPEGALREHATPGLISRWRRSARTSH